MCCGACLCPHERAVKPENTIIARCTTPQREHWLYTWSWNMPGQHLDIISTISPSPMSNIKLCICICILSAELAHLVIPYITRNWCPGVLPVPHMVLGIQPPYFKHQHTLVYTSYDIVLLEIWFIANATPANRKAFHHTLIVSGSLPNVYKFCQ